MIHLDTTFLVDLMREAAGKSPSRGPAHLLLDEFSDESLATTVHVACELHAGAALAKDPEAERTKVQALLAALEVLTPDHRFAPVYGETLAELRRRGRSISTMDLLIASAALVDDAPLVTRNARDFDRVPRLQVRGY